MRVLLCGVDFQVITHCFGVEVVLVLKQVLYRNVFEMILGEELQVDEKNNAKSDKLSFVRVSCKVYLCLK